MNIKSVFSTLTVGVAMMMCGAARAETYALIIGINDYEGDDSDLRGCVNDAKAFRDLLVSKYDVPLSNTRNLYDDSADVEGFVEGMKWLLQSASPGDQIVFFYSGHGVQLDVGEDDDGSDAADGMDECLVLSDLNCVPDNLFGMIGNYCLESNIRASFLMDCCFSGGMSRADARVKYFSGKGKRALKSMGRTSYAPIRAKMRKKGAASDDGSFAYMFASREDQTSIDLGVSPLGRPHGAFTCALLLALRDDPNVTSSELAAAVVTKLRDIDIPEDEQQPTFEFSSDARKDEPLILHDETE